MPSTIRRRSVGDEQIGSFSTYGFGLQAALAPRAGGVQLYYTQTGKGYDTQNPFGDHASYPQPDAGGVQHRRREGLGDRRQRRLRQSRRARPHCVRHLRGGFATGSIPPTAAPIPDRNETDVRVDYAVGKGTLLEGLVATFRYSWLHQDGSPQTQTQLRAYLNYAVRF